MGSPTMSRSSIMDWIRQNPFKLATIVLGGALLGYVMFQGVASWVAFDRIASEDFAPGNAALALEGRTTSTLPPRTTSPPLESGGEDHIAELRERKERIEQSGLLGADESFAGVAEAVSPLLPDNLFTSVLLIGSDASGYLADTIIYILLPQDGSAPLMVSVPRDLYLPDRCSGSYQKINASLGGCSGLATGAELLALNLQDYTGVEVDHFVRVNFDGFMAVVDRLGGAVVCVGDYPVRDPKSGLDLEAGCHETDGLTTLAWMRSRNPVYLVNGVWTSRGGSDFDRQTKQQDLLFQIADRLSSYSTVASLSGALQNLASAVRMDSGWSIGEAASLGFRYRGITKEGVRRLHIPVRDYVAVSGAQALLPSRRFNDILGAAYPSAAR